jgi:hypothetical protein
MAKIITLITILIISGFIYFFLISPHLYTKKWTNLPLKLISMRGTYDNGEGIFFAGLKHVAIKVVASYTEDQIITSDPSQLIKIKQMKDELEQSKQL